VGTGMMCLGRRKLRLLIGIGLSLGNRITDEGAGREIAQRSPSGTDCPSNIVRYSATVTAIEEPNNFVCLA
jgi:hypothetical protein